MGAVYVTSWAYTPIGESSGAKQQGTTAANRIAKGTTTAAAKAAARGGQNWEVPKESRD